jgi:flagellar basal-body rod modification protein FlgD
MSFINPLTSSTGASSTSSGTSNTNPLAGLANNSQEFLQLLVAQLKYQNPMSPVSGTAFLTQTATMTMASEVTQLVQTMNQDLATNQTTTATSMIGKQVTANVQGGSPITGTVSSVSIDPTNGPMLNVGGQSVPLSAVTEVQ